MQLINVKILKNNVPSKATYTYKADKDIKVDDIVTVPVGKSTATGVVTATGVKPEDVHYPLAGIKEIIGVKAEESEETE